ncbi:hypothetical protein AXA88_26215 [Salmonella enterica]|nr:hypothetical protein [Salmonella enterica]EAX3609325.1 hypothetical protein [Salmonella enterica]EGW6282869.1 hypothetical protein [Salmonella enterica]EGX3935281.1 hypothetical protein [Salmonella enterica]EIM7614468.1 hypothetical protein [Salmonella enterica]
MKLTVGDIRFSASGPVNVFATVGVEPDQLPFPVCTMNVTVPMVEGKALEQYKDDLLEVARERIAKMYKEIVCGGNDVGESKAFKVEHGKIIINAAQVEFISQSSKDNLEEHPNESVELSVNRTTNRSNSPYVIVSVSCVDKLNCEILSLNIEVERDDRKDIRHYESVAINKARHIIKRIAIQL